MSLKIMVVDDEPASAKLVRALCAPLGSTVLTFDDFGAAGQRAEMQRFDLVLVGARFPELLGFDLVRQIRNSSPNGETIIAVLSPSNEVAVVRKAFGEGADLVLTKPLAADRLRRMLAAIGSLEWRNRSGARLPLFTDVRCSSGGREFRLRSLNISESGMLLQPALDAEPGQEVALEFTIPEVQASLDVTARIVRNEGSERMAVQFLAVAPEFRNAIQLYVLGKLKDLTPPRDLSGIGLRRVFRN
jgi:CheY-like chemotaxis protein